MTYIDKPKAGKWIRNTCLIVSTPDFCPLSYFGYGVFVTSNNGELVIYERVQILNLRIGKNVND